MSVFMSVLNDALRDSMPVCAGAGLEVEFRLSECALAEMNRTHEQYCRRARAADTNCSMTIESCESRVCKFHDDLRHVDAADGTAGRWERKVCLQSHDWPLPMGHRVRMAVSTEVPVTAPLGGVTPSCTYTRHRHTVSHNHWRVDFTSVSFDVCGSMPKGSIEIELLAASVPYSDAQLSDAASRELVTIFARLLSCFLCTAGADGSVVCDPFPFPCSNVRSFGRRVRRDVQSAQRLMAQHQPVSLGPRELELLQNACGGSVREDNVPCHVMWTPKCDGLRCMLLMSPPDIRQAPLSIHALCVFRSGHTLLVPVRALDARGSIDDQCRLGSGWCLDCEYQASSNTLWAFDAFEMPHCSSWLVGQGMKFAARYARLCEHYRQRVWPDFDGLVNIRLKEWHLASDLREPHRPSALLLQAPSLPYPSDGIVLIVLGADFLIKYKPQHTVDLVLEPGGTVTFCNCRTQLAGPVPPGVDAHTVVECAVSHDGQLMPMQQRRDKRRGNSLQTQIDIKSAAAMSIPSVPDLVRIMWPA